jgi:hypothetical protein
LLLCMRNNKSGVASSMSTMEGRMALSMFSHCCCWLQALVGFPKK